MRTRYGANEMGHNVNTSAETAIYIGSLLPVTLARCEVLRGEALSARVRQEARRMLGQRRPKPQGFYRFDRQ